MATLYSPKIVTDGLIFYADTMNNRSFVSGSTTIRNLGSSQITATIVASNVTLPNVRGNPIRTASPTSVFQSGINLQTLTNFPELNFTRSDFFTLSVWASFEEMQPPVVGANRGIFARGSYNGFVGIAVGKASTSSLANLYVGTRFSNGAALSVELKSSITTGSNAEIFNAVLVYRSSSIDGYLNGAYAGTVNLTNVDTTFAEGSPPSYAINAYGGIGGNASAATMSFYNASIYNRALTAQEIQQNYNAMLPRIGV